MNSRMRAAWTALVWNRTATRVLVVLEADTIVVTIPGQATQSVTASCMTHPGLSPQTYATTPTLRSASTRFEHEHGSQLMTKRENSAGSCELRRWGCLG